MKNKLSSPTATRKSAFTLIEIMVATVVMVILVGLVIQITSEVLKVWNRSSGKLSANAEARIAMELLSQDLETAVFRNNGLQWLRAEDATLNGPGGSTPATVALRLFTPAADRDMSLPGDICAVAYSLDYKNAVDGTDTDDRSFVLYRMLVQPPTTFDNLLGEAVQATLPSAGANNWGTNSIQGTEGANYLVSNIVNFEIDFHVQDDASPPVTEVPNNTIYGGSDATVGPQAGNPDFRKPLSHAVIKLTIISDEGMQLLRNLDRIAQNFDEVVAEHGEVFVRRVNFLARPI
jgi:prepilin-type N-terminal cleavage/methylation domain-containing protein